MAEGSFPNQENASLLPGQRKQIKGQNWGLFQPKLRILLALSFGSFFILLETASTAAKISFHTLPTCQGELCQSLPWAFTALSPGQYEQLLKLSSLLLFPHSQLADTWCLISKTQWAPLLSAKSKPQITGTRNSHLLSSFPEFPLNLDQIFTSSVQPHQPPGSPAQLRKILLCIRPSTHDILFIPCKPLKINTIMPILYMRTLSSVVYARSCHLGKAPSTFTALWGLPVSLYRCVLCV